MEGDLFVETEKGVEPVDDGSLLRGVYDFVKENEQQAKPPTMSLVDEWVTASLVPEHILGELLDAARDGEGSLSYLIAGLKVAHRELTAEQARIDAWLEQFGYENDPPWYGIETGESGDAEH